MMKRQSSIMPVKEENQKRVKKEEEDGEEAASQASWPIESARTHAMKKASKEWDSASKKVFELLLESLQPNRAKQVPIFSYTDKQTPVLSVDWAVLAGRSCVFEDMLIAGTKDIILNASKEAILVFSDFLYVGESDHCLKSIVLH